MRAILGAVMALAMALPVWAGEVDDDGLHVAAWYRDTFKDLQEDAAEAAAEGKRLLIIVEQRGCIYCKKMHETSFLDPRVLKHLEETYYPVRINLHADTEMVDTDGEALSEKAATRKWGIMFTPTMIFMPPEVSDDKPANMQAVAIMPGAFSPGTTYDLMTWVQEERYLDQSEEDFQRYHARMIRDRQNGKTD